ncbi:MAG: sodium:proton antiporter [Gammaproteobacteria bacterium]|nr:sodium:proton antiporter [Rhodocyclaceae bacterium]MBU3909035.1 sodium:proton antiporter [Gammaproteobacteria bacterium]MBU3988886.1 sodium:proton antiporter [Gammaproteobacteria bacterium]MBU4003792.1 sodium:proton antiporter [Gammaproteobacteria bacterium]MBU4021670.1 sodium:proton antiporter [Gammaproteobacteria bacterium]
MTDQTILSASLFLLIAFGVERICRRWSVPSVLVLVAIGLIARPLLDSFDLQLTWAGRLVPIIGTIGLVLIVLEGALDIELRRERIGLIKSTLFLATAGFVICVVVFAMVAHLLLDLGPVHAVLLATPFAVISSAVAIPSSAFLPRKEREFVVYETSMSDIIGVLVFFSLLGSDGSIKGALLTLLGGGVLSLLLSILCAVALMLVLLRVEGHIRFVPLLAGLFVLYSAGKLFHLSPLIMVLFLGLLLNKPSLVTRFRPFHNWVGDDYDATLSELKTVVVELTFVVRGFFFVLLGYWTDLSDLVSPWAWLVAAFALAVIFGSRFALLRLMQMNPAAAGALGWIAPRGLITVLLFIHAREAFVLPSFLNGAVILVVLASSALILVARFSFDKQEKPG